jgi:hypothetical protein
MGMGASSFLGHKESTWDKMCCPRYVVDLFIIVGLMSGISKPTKKGAVSPLYYFFSLFISDNSDSKHINNFITMLNNPNILLLSKSSSLNLYSKS